MNSLRQLLRWYSFLPLIVIFALVPILDGLLPKSFQFAEYLIPIFIFAVLALGLNVVTGYTGMLNLGVAGFMAVGAYVYAIATCDIYPFQLYFYPALFAAMVAGAITGVLLGLPTMRLAGDYLAIVTLGFGEIVQSLLRNLDTITKGTQGINPLPPPTIFGYVFPFGDYRPHYYLYLVILLVVTFICCNLENSRVGRVWKALREDELASRCMGIEASKRKIAALAVGSAMCALAGAMWASYLGSTGEPGNYDFQISIMVLCVVIVGGMGSIRGVLLGTVLVMGFNSILLVKLSEFLMRGGYIEGGSVFFTPGNWKYLIFGIALVLMMRLKPDGLFGEKG